jgi:hypothetical protein
MVRVIAHEVLDVLKVGQIALPEHDSTSVMPCAVPEPAGPRRSSILRGAAYLAALQGEPWRPHA